MASKAISVWALYNGTNFIIQADNIVDGVSTITNLSDNGGNANDPQIAIDNTTGNAISVWTFNNGVEDNTIQSSYYTKSSNSWSTPIDIVLSGNNPEVSMDSNGDAVCVWDSGSIQASNYSKSSNSWSIPRLISLNGGIAENSKLAIDTTTGDAISVWSRFNQGRIRVIQASHYTKSRNTWSAPKNLSAVGVDSINPQISIDNSTGNAIVVWLSNASTIIKTSYYTKSRNTWSTPKNISPVGEDSADPQIAIDNTTGDAISVWTSTTLVRNIKSLSKGNTKEFAVGIIMGSLYNKSKNTWSEPMNLSLIGGNSAQPQIAIDNTTGNAISVWVSINLLKASSNVGNNIIQTSYYTKSKNTWSTPKNISTVGEDSTDPQIAIDNTTGNAVSVWYSYNMTNYIVRASYYTKGSNSWSVPVNLSPDVNDAGFPQIAVYNSPEPLTTTTLPPKNRTTVRFSINAKYYDLIIDSETLATYENALIDAIVSLVGAPRDSITIISVTPGSIVNELSLPTEYVARLQYLVQNGFFYITINGIRYYAIASSFVIVDNICFRKGTNILTPSGYKQIESLTRGDLVTTAQGRVVKIQKITNFTGSREKCPLYVLQKDTLGPNMPLIDLYMSEGHAYRHNGQWCHMKCSSAAMEVDVDNIDYYNIALDNYLENTLVANGVEVESLFNMKGLEMTWNCNTDNCKPVVQSQK